MADAVQFFDGSAPDALFLNAGIGGGRYQLEDLDVDRFDAIMRTNVRGVFLWLRAALPLLKKLEEPSQIVVTSSVLGNRATTQAAAYCASLPSTGWCSPPPGPALGAPSRSFPAAIATPWWVRGRVRVGTNLTLTPPTLPDPPPTPTLLSSDPTLSLTLNLTRTSQAQRRVQGHAEADGAAFCRRSCRGLHLAVEQPPSSNIEQLNLEAVEAQACESAECQERE